MCAPREINGHEKTQKQAKNRRSGRERNTNFVHNCGLLQFEVFYFFSIAAGPPTLSQPGTFLMPVKARIRHITRTMRSARKRPA